MISFQKLDKRQYKIFHNENELTELDLVFSPATNKFEKIVEYVEDCSKVLGEGFDTWFSTYIIEYISSGMNPDVIRKNVPLIKKWSNEYLECIGINFEGYINKSKISKNSIFFDSDEIKKMIQCSNFLKLYFIISQESKMKLSLSHHKEIYNELVKEISQCDIIFKLFKIVSSKTYRYNITDSYMWEYIRMIYCKTTDMHIMSIFNFLINNILVTCDPKENPVPYMISVIDESIKWLLQSVYKDIIIYSDTVNTEDIYTVHGRDNLKTYAYNDTLGKLVILAYNYLEKEKIDEVTFNETIKNISSHSIFATYFTYPILSKVLNIPYRHFLTIPVEHSYLLNVLIFHCLSKKFKDKYSTICQFLLFYNSEKIITKTTYKIKNIEQLYQTITTFLGFKNLTFPYEFYSNVIGKICRNSYSDFKTGKLVTNFPLANIENELILFFNSFFGESLTQEFEHLEATLNELI